MRTGELSEKQKNVVRRYIEVWRRFRRLPDRHHGFTSLEADLAQGSGMLLCGLLVEAQASTLITADAKDPKFHAAIFGNDDNAVPDVTPDELQQARRYVIHGEGIAPVRCWGAKPPFSAVVAGTDANEEPPPDPPLAA